MVNIRSQKTPKWALTVNRINNYLSTDLPGGPKFIKMSWVINLHKGLTFFFVLFLMNFYKNFSTVAYIYLALHGSYGFIWIIKHIAFRDKKWESRITVTGVFFIFTILSSYWIAPFILISGMFTLTATPLSGYFIVFAIILYSTGLAIMVAADSQKNVLLRYKKGLITDGLFKHIRHPNYLGEMMIYSSFSILANHWIPWVILAFWWGLVFLVNMIIIESSLSRFPEWTEYKRRTGMIFPRYLFKRYNSLK